MQSTWLQQPQANTSRSGNRIGIAITYLPKLVLLLGLLAGMAVTLPGCTKGPAAQEGQAHIKAPQLSNAGAGKAGVGPLTLPQQESNHGGSSGAALLTPVVGKGEVVATPQTQEKAQSVPGGVGEKPNEVVGDVHEKDSSEKDWRMVAALLGGIASAGAAGFALGMGLPPSPRVGPAPSDKGGASSTYAPQRTRPTPPTPAPRRGR